MDRTLGPTGAANSAPPPSRATIRSCWQRSTCRRGARLRSTKERTCSPSTSGSILQGSGCSSSSPSTPSTTCLPGGGSADPDLALVSSNQETALTVQEISPSRASASPSRRGRPARGGFSSASHLRWRSASWPPRAPSPPTSQCAVVRASRASRRPRRSLARAGAILVWIIFAVRPAIAVSSPSPARRPTSKVAAQVGIIWLGRGPPDDRRAASTSRLARWSARPA